MSFQRIRDPHWYARPLRWLAYGFGGFGALWVLAAVVWGIQGDADAAIGALMFAAVSAGIGGGAFYGARRLSRGAPAADKVPETAEHGPLPEAAPGIRQHPEVGLDRTVRGLTPTAFVDAPALAPRNDFVKFLPGLIGPVVIAGFVVVGGLPLPFTLLAVLAAVPAALEVRRRAKFVWYAIDDGELLVRGWEGKVLAIDVRTIREVRAPKRTDRAAGTLKAGEPNQPSIVIQWGRRGNRVMISPSDPQRFAARLRQEQASVSREGWQPSRQRLGDTRSAVRRYGQQLGTTALLGGGIFIFARFFISDGLEGQAVPAMPLEQVVALDAGDACSGPGPRVCIVPVGVSSNLDVQALASYYSAAPYNLQVDVLPHYEAPASAVDSGRRQVMSDPLMDSLIDAYPGLFVDRDVVLIIVTPYDLAASSNPDLRFIFGATRGGGIAVISTFRMDPRHFGQDEDAALLKTRAQKLLTKYVGMLYYKLPTTGDEESVLYNGITGLKSLDRIGTDFEPPTTGP